LKFIEQVQQKCYQQKKITMQDGIKKKKTYAI